MVSEEEDDDDDVDPERASVCMCNLMPSERVLAPLRQLSTEIRPGHYFRMPTSISVIFNLLVNQAGPLNSDIVAGMVGDIATLHQNLEADFQAAQGGAGGTSFGFRHEVTPFNAAAATAEDKATVKANLGSMPHITSEEIKSFEKLLDGESNQDDKPDDDKPADDKLMDNKPADDKPEHNKRADDKPATGQNNIKDDFEGFSAVDMHTTIENLKEMDRAGFKLPNKADEDNTPFDIAFDKAYNDYNDDDSGKASREAFVKLFLEPIVQADSNIKESLSIMVNSAKHEGKDVVHAFQFNMMQYDSYVRAKAQVRDACKKLKTARDIIDACSEEISGALFNMHGAK